MRNEIILIGPMMAGKSTAASIVSKYSGWPIVCLDKIKWKYFSEQGITFDYLEHILLAHGAQYFTDYCKPFEINLLEKTFIENKSCIFDLGAGFSVSNVGNLQDRIKNIFSNFKNIFLILPSENKIISKRIILNRLKDRIKSDPCLEKIYLSLYELALYFIEHPGNNFLAKNVLYTHGVGEQQIIQQFLDKMTCEDRLMLTGANGP